MRKAYFLLLLAPAALVYACGGGDDSDGGTDASNDQTTNGASKPDTSTNDTGTTEAGKDAAPDVTINITCLRPSNCFDGGAQDAADPPDSGEVCCGTIATSGSFPNCAFGSASTA